MRRFLKFQPIRNKHYLV